MTFPDTVMLLAAGLGTRMRPLSDTTPKPLIEVGGRALIDWCLELARAGGVTRAVVNMHYLADRIAAHFSDTPGVILSDERQTLLDTGGGVVKALPLLGEKPFFVMGTDAVIVDSGPNSARRLAEAWNDAATDCVMLLHPTKTAHGFDGPGDFFCDGGRLQRRGAAVSAPYVYAGIYLIHPRAFAAEAAQPFSMNKIWDRLIAADRLRAVIHNGHWFHVGTPDAVAPTTAALTALGLAK